MVLDGVTLARRYGRDDPVRLASNVVVIEGAFPSYGGSRAHPAVCAPEVRGCGCVTCCRRSWRACVTITRLMIGGW